MQQLIANAMAVRVIYLLEAVQVQIQHGQLPASALRAQQGALQAIHEQYAIGQLCQLVVLREEGEFIVGTVPADGGGQLTGDKVQKLGVPCVEDWTAPPALHDEYANGHAVVQQGDAELRRLSAVFCLGRVGA